MESYLTIKNWKQFQQYKDRDPKWIKLHRDILNDYDFDQLSEIQQNHLMKIWLLASKLDNKIPNDPVWIGRQIGAKSKINIKQLVTSGFIVVYDSVQECTKTYLETETETETETEKRESNALRATRLPKDWKPDKQDIEYCKTNRKDLNPEVVAENFRDYWTSKPTGATKLDWSATWRSWVRKENTQRTNGHGATEITTASHDRVDFNKLRDADKFLMEVDRFK